MAFGFIDTRLLAPAGIARLPIAAQQGLLDAVKQYFSHLFDYVSGGARS